MIHNNELKNAVILKAAPSKLDGTGEMAEVQVIDAHTGETLLNPLLAPATGLDADAAEAYGLPTDYLDGPVKPGSYPDYEDRLKALLVGNVVLMDADEVTANLLVNSAKAHNRPTGWIENLAMAHRVPAIA